MPFKAGLPKMVGYKPSSIEESIDLIKSRTYCGMAGEDMRFSRIDIASDVGAERALLMMNLDMYQRKIPSPYRARYDTTLYLMRGSKGVQRFRIYDRTEKTGGLEVAENGDSLLRFELQRRRAQTVRQQFGDDRVAWSIPDLMYQRLAKELIPFGYESTDFDQLITLDGFKVLGFIFMRNIYGEKHLRECGAFSKNSFYKLRKAAAAIDDDKVPVENLSMKVVRAIASLKAPHLLDESDADMASKLSDELLERSKEFQYERECG